MVTKTGKKITRIQKFGSRKVICSFLFPRLLDGSCNCHEQATACTTPKPKGTTRKHTEIV